MSKLAEESQVSNDAIRASFKSVTSEPAAGTGPFIFLLGHLFAPKGGPSKFGGNCSSDTSEPAWNSPPKCILTRRLVCHLSCAALLRPVIARFLRRSRASRWQKEKQFTEGISSLYLTVAAVSSREPQIERAGIQAAAL